jgi:hypothetical protein
VKIRTYASFVRFSHSVFALPFALTGALLAVHRSGDWSPATIGWRMVWIVVAMVSARSAAMGFNRLVDARHDALNPRTAMRELPRGAMTGREAAAFVLVASVVFLGAAWKLGPLCLALAPVALAIVFWGAADGNRGCSAWPSARGWAVSTSCTPARTCRSIARTACDRSPCASAWRGRSSFRGRCTCWP